jgi:hypothetical protein
MSANQSSRLRAVGASEDGGSAGGVPMEVLRFATLPESRRTLLMQVSDLLEQIDFGNVVIVMHEGKVTQIETSEKIRLSHELPREGDQPRSS